MLHKISVTAAVAILLWAGLLQRSWTDYWLAAPALAEAAERIQQVPLNLGTWRGQAVQQDANDGFAAGYSGSVWRRYEDSASGTVLSVLLVCGPPGPLSVHTPDACYGGVGYERLADSVRFKLTGLGAAGPASFWQADFGKPTQVHGGRLRIYWAWYADERWQAVDNPRLTFMNLPVLYKLYVVCDITAANKEKSTEACVDFMKCLLPELRKLFTPPAPEEVINPTHGGE